MLLLSQLTPEWLHCFALSPQTMAKRPMSAIGNKRPVSEYARVAATMGAAFRYQVRLLGSSEVFCRILAPEKVPEHISKKISEIWFSKKLVCKYVMCNNYQILLCDVHLTRFNRVKVINKWHCTAWVMTSCNKFYKWGAATLGDPPKAGQLSPVSTTNCNHGSAVRRHTMLMYMFIDLFSIILIQ